MGNELSRTSRGEEKEGRREEEGGYRRGKEGVIWERKERGRRRC